MLRVIAYLGLGSNVGDRLASLRTAADRLNSHDGIEVVARSSVYETEPMGDITDQPDFLNGAVRVETALDPIELLRACKGVEREMGRAPGGLRHGPRPIDVDVLLAGDLTIDAGGLVLPHPETTARRFVLAPLLELDPELALPDGTKLTDALAALEGQRVARIGTL